MQISFTQIAWDDYLIWQKTDRKTLSKINSLIKEINRSPFEGSGNPERLKHELSDCYSRRIDSKNRLVYTIKNETCIILQCKGHYQDH